MSLRLMGVHRNHRQRPLGNGHADCSKMDLVLDLVKSWYVSFLNAKGGVPEMSIVRACEGGLGLLQIRGFSQRTPRESASATSWRPEAGRRSRKSRSRQTPRAEAGRSL